MRVQLRKSVRERAPVKWISRLDKFGERVLAEEGSIILFFLSISTLVAGVPLFCYSTFVDFFPLLQEFKEIYQHYIYSLFTNITFPCSEFQASGMPMWVFHRKFVEKTAYIKFRKYLHRYLCKPPSNFV